MALINLDFFSEALGMQSEVLVVMPQRGGLGEIGVTNNGGSRNIKVLYLLHGLSDDQTIWMRRTSIERYAGYYGVCVVMPNGHRSFYTDMKYGGDYYKYITKELPMRMQEFFNVSDKREDTFIAGLSMGGYGALKAALREPDRYAAASALSAVTDIAEFCGERSELFTAIFGEGQAVPDEDDLIKLVDAHKNDKIKPGVFIGIGRQDGLYDQNVRFKKILEDNGYDLTYRESDGVHCWEFWDEYILYTLQWMFGKK
jgi:S-formylglutathione hydrolase FrmB